MVTSAAPPPAVTCCTTEDASDGLREEDRGVLSDDRGVPALPCETFSACAPECADIGVTAGLRFSFATTSCAVSMSMDHALDACVFLLSAASAVWDSAGASADCVGCADCGLGLGLGFQSDEEVAVPVAAVAWSACCTRGSGIFCESSGPGVADVMFALSVDFRLASSTLNSHVRTWDPGVTVDMFVRYGTRSRQVWRRRSLDKL